MSEFLGNSWIILTDIYHTIYIEGLEGCIVAFVIGIILSNIGVKITGRSESFTGTVTNGYANLRRNPAVQGTATTWLGHMFGVLLQFGGLILVIMAIIAFVNIVMYGVPRK